jgi:hypothetical protein
VDAVRCDEVERWKKEKTEQGEKGVFVRGTLPQVLFSNLAR